MELLVRYDYDYRAYKRTFNTNTRSKFAKGIAPHGNKGFSSAFFVFGEIFFSLSLSLSAPLLRNYRAFRV